MSTASPSMLTSRACSNMPVARPPSSSGVGPLILIATPKAAIWAEVALSDMISFIAHAVSAADRSRPSARAPSTCGQLRARPS
ncbi:Uncharacterised protein [Mycobacteroides abscessus subsp. abscessus]|nr:Uncharacterised protein [Mycobacteroides abscessus subsp. abscessus]